MAVVPVVANEQPASGEHLPVIDLDEFEEDSRDEGWQEFLREARKYRATMQLDGRVK
jgi:hypothetical protein